MTTPFSAPVYQDRNQAFSQGQYGGDQAGPMTAAFTPPSFAQNQAQYNSSVPRSYRPSGSLNGMSAGQYTNTMGGMFGNPNGQAMSTYQTKKYFEPRGQ